MKTQARRCWSCTIAIPRRKRSTPDRRVRCPRRSTNSTSFSPAWDQVLRYDDAANQSHQEACGRFRSNGVTPSMRKTAFLLMTLVTTDGSAQQKPTTGYAPVNGLKMYYEVHGGGEPVVLLHGAFMTITNNWDGWISELAKTRKVIAVEMQGHGRTADIPRDLTPENLADDVAAL